MAKQKYHVGDRLICIKDHAYIKKGDKITIACFESKASGYRNWIVPEEDKGYRFPPDIFEIYKPGSYSWGILNFLRTHPLISVRGLETAIGIPKDTIRNALELKRELPEKHFGKIEEILHNYGYVRIWGVPATAQILEKVSIAEKKEKLKHLFTCDGKPFMLVYQYRKSGHYKEDLPALNEMIKEGIVLVIEKTTKDIKFQYIGPCE